ncbi:MAG: hypothetical protein Terrestrivirus1_134 [Terrestrivirus sp.]|uniref:Fe2OG dioxygenase domain-containing protein n=1 Tax=Terrestrivirus sp. TaxID=2487775 RepID=A0A3G4ZK99_9VIRU|nr:MAG: hypothetical protein Terrestrivirus1_134 [Terrestrivirus sp.]
MIQISLLPDADVFYYKGFVSDELGTKLYETIKGLFEQENTKKIKYGENFYKLNRKTIAFVSPDLNIDVIPKIWGHEISIIKFDENLIKLKEMIEEKTNFKFNICLANYYENGKKTIGWHADNEEKGSTSCIASISMGVTRDFKFRIKDQLDACLTIPLESNSLLIMAKNCQELYQHSVPPNKECTEPRLNLTFRLFDVERYTT